MALRTCKAVKKDGTLCKVPAIRGRDFCRLHGGLRAIKKPPLESIKTETILLGVEEYCKLLRRLGGQ